MAAMWEAKAELERAFQWYKLIPGQVVENGGFKVLWDFILPYNRMFDARRPDIIFVDASFQLEVGSVGSPAYCVLSAF